MWFQYIVRQPGLGNYYIVIKNINPNQKKLSPQKMILFLNFLFFNSLLSVDDREKAYPLR